MTSILESALAQTIGSAMSALFMDAVLTRDVQVSSGDAADPAAPTQTTYSCKAIHDTYGTGLLGKGLVEAGDFRVIILASTLSTTPKSGDRITITVRGLTGTIVPNDSGGVEAVTTDPALATWECRCRK